jgi:hypothetical protein
MVHARWHGENRRQRSLRDVQRRLTTQRAIGQLMRPDADDDEVRVACPCGAGNRGRARAVQN